MQTITDLPTFLTHLGQITTLLLLLPLFVAIYYKQYWNKPLYIAFVYCVLTFAIHLLEQSIVFFDFDNKVAPSGIIIPYFQGFLLMGSLLFLPLLYRWVKQIPQLRIPIRKSPYFWIGIGVFLPNMLGVFLFAVGDFLYATDYALFCQWFIAKHILVILGQFLLAIGFSCSYYVRFIRLDGKTVVPTLVGSVTSNSYQHSEYPPIGRQENYGFLKSLILKGLNVNNHR